jgi:hypothetical protein
MESKTVFHYWTFKCLACGEGLSYHVNVFGGNREVWIDTDHECEEEYRKARAKIQDQYDRGLISIGERDYKMGDI